MLAQSHPAPTLVERGWRYTLIGAFCALANYLIMLANDALGGYYLLGTIIAFVIVTPIGYVLHSLITFAEPFRLSAFLRFTAGVASTYPIVAILMIILCSGLKLSVAVAWPIVTVLTFAWNFAAAHWSIMPGFAVASSRIAEHAREEVR
jgi:putative flippase GtrA